MNKANCKIRNAVVIGAILVGTGSMDASAQGNLMIYPGSGQSPQQQQQDQYQCHTWAPSSSPASIRPVRRRSRRAAIEALPGRKPLRAALVARLPVRLSARPRGGLKRRFQEKDRQTQSATASPPGPDNYNRAMTSCLEALGYSVN